MQPLLNSDGSAEYSLSVGDPRERPCRVICSVNGPLEAKVRDEIPTQATLEVVVRPHIGVTAIREVLMQDVLHQCFSSIVLRDAMPRSLVQVVVQVLEAGERNTNVNELAAGVNGASIALSAAAVPLSGLCVGVSAAYVDGSFILHPSQTELDTASSSFFVAFKYSKGPEDPEVRIVSLQSAGSFSQDDLIRAIEQAHDESLNVYLGLRETVYEQYKESTRWSS